MVVDLREILQGPTMVFFFPKFFKKRKLEMWSKIPERKKKKEKKELPSLFEESKKKIEEREERGMKKMLWRLASSSLCKVPYNTYL